MKEKEYRRSLFKREDGTLIIPTVTFVVVLITSIFVLLGVKSNTRYTPGTPKTTTKAGDNKKTTEITEEFKQECKGCSLSFTRQYVEVEANSEVDLNDIMAYKGFTPYYVKFKDYDEELISVDSSKLLIKVNNALGETNLTAYYQNMSTSIKIIISQKYITDANIKRQFNYVYLGATGDLEVELFPKGIDRKYLRIVSNDPSIVEVDEEGHLVGKSLGKATVRLDIDGVSETEQKTATVYVVKNKITPYFKTDKGFFLQDEKTTYTAKIKGYIQLAIKFEDNFNSKYSIDDVSINVENFGCYTVNKDEIEYAGVNQADESMHVFKLPIYYNADTLDKVGYNGVKVYFSLPDGSVAQFNINRTEES